MSDLKKRYCPQCGSEVEASSKFCSNCGAKLAKKDEDAINDALNDIFSDLPTSNEHKSVEDTVVIPRFNSEPKKETTVDYEPVQPKAEPLVRQTPPDRPQPTKRPVQKEAEKESRLPIVLTVIATLLAIVLIAGGAFMIYKAMQPKEPDPIVNNDIPDNNNQQDPTPINPDNNNQEQEPPVDENQQPDDEKDNHEPSEDLKDGMSLEYTSQMNQLEGIAAVTGIEVKAAENDVLEFTVNYESSEDLTMIFANAPDGQVFKLEVDVTSGGKYAYFQISKSILSADQGLMITLIEIPEEGSQGDGTPIGSGTVSVSAEVMADVLAKAGIE